MNTYNNISQRYLQPMVRVAETPRRVHMNKRRTPKGCYFFNLLNYSCNGQQTADQ